MSLLVVPFLHGMLYGLGEGVARYLVNTYIRKPTVIASPPPPPPPPAVASTTVMVAAASPLEESDLMFLLSPASFLKNMLNIVNKSSTDDLVSLTKTILERHATS